MKEYVNFNKIKNVVDNNFLFILVRKYMCYEKAENVSSIISKLYSTFLSVGLLFAASPLFQTIHRVFIQKLSLEESYLLPVVCTLPFELISWPKYAFAFIWTYSCYFSLVVSKIIISPIQFTLCFHTIGVMRNLRMIVNEFNDIKLVA